MIRRAALALIAAAAAASAAACDRTDDEEVVTLRITSWQSPDENAIDAASWREFERLHPGVRVVMASSRTQDLENALAALPSRDAKVLRLYFGLDDGNSRTLEEIGRMMGVTRERIRQLRDRALRQLREEHGDKLKELAA